MAKKKSEAFEKQNMFILILLIIFFILTMLLYFVFNITSLDYSKSQNNSISENTNSQITVTQIIDGDTFVISSGETVRLICVDTPEQNKKGYEEAKQFLSDLILDKQIRLEKDVSDTDSYGRLLRYVYVQTTADSCLIQPEPPKPNEVSNQICIGSNTNTKEVFVNRELVQKDYATLFPYGNDTKRCSEIAA